MWRDCAHHVAGFACVIHDASASVTEGTSSTHQHLEVVTGECMYWASPGLCGGSYPLRGASQEAVICETLKQGNISKDSSSLVEVFEATGSESLKQNSSQLAAGNRVGSSVPENCSLKPTCMF